MTHRLSALPRSSVAHDPCTSRTTLDLDYGFGHVGPDSNAGPSAPPSVPDADQNQLLASLPAADLERLSPHLQLVPMSLGEMLYEPGRRLQYAYFPTTSVVSLHYGMKCGASPEAAGVGNEGVVGISLFLGANTAPSSAVVQTAGYGYRLPGRLLQQEFNRAGSMQRLLLRYTQTLIAQMILTVACNRQHLAEQQLCRFMLLTMDRVRSPNLVMTQELIGSLLGLRRECIGLAAERLRDAGLISYRRGQVTVLERSGLEARACECYSMVKAELSRLQSDVRHRQDSRPASTRFLPGEDFGADGTRSSVAATLENWQFEDHRQRRAKAEQRSIYAISP